MGTARQCPTPWLKSGRPTRPVATGIPPIDALLRSTRRSRASAARERTSAGKARERRRSEEHTSELQSRENLVCRLLLEKNKRHIYHLWGGAIGTLGELE